MYLTQGLHRAVQQHPDAVATICAGRIRTHAETVDRIARLAAALRGLGLQDGDRAAILSLNSDRFHEFLGATLWAGGVVVPVNIRWAVPEIAESLAEVDARILVVDDFFAPYLDGIRDVHPRLQHVIHAGDGPIPDGALSFEDLIAASEPMDDVRRGGTDLAGIFYTGGTTGRSKGVMLSHAGLLTSPLGLLAGEHFMCRGGVGLHAAPMFHVAAFGVWVTGQIVGGTQVMIPSFEPVAVLTAVQEHQVDEMLLVPTMIQLVVDHPRIDEFDLTSLRRIIYGASPMSDALLGRALKAWPNARFLQAYGMTELSPAATVLTSEDHEDPRHRRSVGRAAPHTEVRIVGPDDVELPRGEAGRSSSAAAT